MQFTFNKIEFLDFMEATRVDNAKRACAKHGYTLEIEGRGDDAVFHLDINFSDEDYTEFYTLKEVKEITEAPTTKKALAKFMGGNNRLVGHLVFYAPSARILNLRIENRIRYVFTINPILASGFTYATLGLMIGVSDSQARYWVKKVAEQDGLKLSEGTTPYKTGLKRLGHVYTYSSAYHEALKNAFRNKSYYNMDLFQTLMWEHNYSYTPYKDKIINIDNVHLMRKFETETPIETLFPLKSEEIQADLEKVIDNLTAVHKIISYL